MKRIIYVSIATIVLSIAGIQIGMNCSDSSSDNSLALAALALAGSSGSNTSCTSTTSKHSTCTTQLNVTACPAAVNLANDPAYTGGPTCVTNIAAAAPCWIKQNFHCVTVTVDSANCTMSITTTALPPHKSAYYRVGTSEPYDAYNEAFDTSGGRGINPNEIKAQSITLTVPVRPTYEPSCQDSTQGIDALGITVNGVTMFNNQAAPGDSLATEYLTMDSHEGHPQNTGKYHHHTEPTEITNDDSALIGIMLDGYPVYGKKTQSSTYPTLDSTTHAVACSPTQFPGANFPDQMYCYHVANGSGVNADLIGSYFRGKRGTTN